jgi:pimeloyl-ACP methyl ester carboxylesterase
MKHPGKTRPFLGPDGRVIPNSIAEIRYLRLGGLSQWVMVRGESLANPPLILLHGGPGFSEMRLFRRYNGPLERSFTVVYWDQRGAGKSFNSNIPKSSMTVEQFIADLDELVDTPRSARCMLRASRRRSRRTSAADRLAIGRRASWRPMSGRLRKRSVSATPRH